MPLARYSGSSTPKDASDAARNACALTASQQPFDAARLKQLYQNRNEYLRRLRTAVDQAVLERRLVKEDGEALKNSCGTEPAGVLINNCQGLNGPNGAHAHRHQQTL